MKPIKITLEAFKKDTDSTPINGTRRLFMIDDSVTTSAALFSIIKEEYKAIGNPALEKLFINGKDVTESTFTLSENDKVSYKSYKSIEPVNPEAATKKVVKPEVERVKRSSISPEKQAQIEAIRAKVQAKKVNK